MTHRCPHCGKLINIGQILGSVRTPAKSQAARTNGKLGGRPRSDKPVRLRPYHPGHRDHLKWLAAQAKKLNRAPSK